MPPCRYYHQNAKLPEILRSGTDTFELENGFCAF